MKTLFAFIILLLPLTVVAQDAPQTAQDRFKALTTPKPPEVVPDAPVAPQEEPEPPSVTFAIPVAAAPERWLAVGDNCPACPAGKSRFLSSGGKPTNIVDWRVSNGQHRQQIKVIPSEYLWSPPAQSVVATANVSASPEAVVYVLGEYLRQLQAIESYNKVSKTTASPPVDAAIQTYGGWFSYDVDVPDSIPFLLQKLMKDKQYKNDKLGLLLTWPGEQTLKLSGDRITITPAIKASVNKLGITASASVSEIRFTSDYKTVTIITPELLVPDLTINFK
jgi:hypothetical protein